VQFVTGGQQVVENDTAAGGMTHPFADNAV
jgi:hypothetical protein